MLTLTANGSVRYRSDRASVLQGKIANIARVNRLDVTIGLQALRSDEYWDSVTITATIVVRASTTAAAVQASLASTLGSASSASTALGMWVLSHPTMSSTGNKEATVLGAPIGAVVGGVCGAFLTIVLCCFYARRRRSSAKARAACNAAGRSRVAPNTAQPVAPNVTQPGAPPQPQQQLQMSAAVPIAVPPIQQMGSAVPIVLEGTIVQSTPYACGAPLMPPPCYGAPQTASPLPGGGMYPGAGYPHEPAGAQPLVLMGQVVQ